MANKGVKGRIVDETDAGIKDLTVRAVDFDPFFNEDDTLKTGKTDANGNFELTYSTEDFTFWDPHGETGWDEHFGQRVRGAGAHQGIDRNQPGAQGISSSRAGVRDERVIECG